MSFEIITSVVYGDHCLNVISSSFCLLLSFEPQQLTSSHSHHSKASLWRIRRHICYQCIVLPICTLPCFVADHKVKISVVFDNQLVIIVAYSVTDKSSFSVT